MGISIRVAERDDDLEAWRRVRMAVLPNERCMSAAEMRDQADAETLYLVAEHDGELAGSGFAGRSSFDHAVLHSRVIPAMRRRGVGTAILRRLEGHAVARGYTETGSIVEDAGSLTFAQRHGLHEVDRQVELIRAIGHEPRPVLPEGIEVVTVAQRPELWKAAYEPFGLEALADMATDRPVSVTREQWEREWLSWPEAMFLALADGRVVACAGLELDEDRPDRAENAFTAVARDWRGRGLALLLKRMALAVAAERGIREVYTWTQTGNAAMRSLNERLGYRPRGEAIYVRGPLPLRRGA
jgi:GNAT superfamily N-acetyltransferase